MCTQNLEDWEDELLELLDACRVDGRLGYQFARWCRQHQGQLRAAVAHLRAIRAFTRYYNKRRQLAETSLRAQMNLYVF